MIQPNQSETLPELLTMAEVAGLLRRTRSGVEKKADQQASPQTHLHDNSTDAQRVRLLARLYAGPVDTFTARSELNILMPAARVKELRELGYPIKTHRITLADDHGRPHHGVAMYYLGTLPPARQGKTGTDLFSPPPTQLIQPPSFLPGPPTSPSSAHPVPDWQPAGRRS